MTNYTGIFINYSQGLHQQYPKRGVIKVTGLKPDEAGKVIGWLVGWPAEKPTIYGKISGQHGKSGYLTANFKRGLPGNAIGKPVVITEIKEIVSKAPKPSSDKPKSDSNITEIEGIGPKYADKLNEHKINTLTELLQAGATPSLRKQLAEKTGISPKLILDWVNIADLFRIKGIGEEYADLLEKAGVDTVVELSTRKPENLHTKIVELNKEKKIVRRIPSLSTIEGWIAEAKTLPRKVEY